MSELDRTAWAREANRLEKQIVHRKKRVAEMQQEIFELGMTYDALQKKIADDYREEHGTE